MRLIDADRLMNVLSEYDEKPGNLGLYEYGRQQMLETIGYEVDNAPTVDAVPVVHGHWIDRGYIGNDNRNYMCSVCGAGETHTPRVEVRYCWNCGARMDGKGNDNEAD